MLENREMEADWNLTSLFSSEEEWERNYLLAKSSENAPFWPEIAAFRGRLEEGSATIRILLDTLFALYVKLTKIYTFVHLRHDEDVTDSKRKSAFLKARTLLTQFEQEIAFFEPELFAVDSHKLETFLQEAALQPYKHHIERLLKQKPHRLTTREEELLALVKEPLETPYKTFNALTDGDFLFPSIKDQSGEEYPLTHASFGEWIRSPDATLRKNAFLTYHEHYEKHQNSLAELLSGQVLKAHFFAKARRYSSCLEAALLPNDIPVSVYHSLTEAALERAPSLKKYFTLRKERLGVDQLKLWDLYVPLIPHLDLKFTLEEAIQLVIDSSAPLGLEYQSVLRRGLKEEGWLDAFEKRGKRSGAYSSGCHGSLPYILMNYRGGIRDLFTLAHEAGHSMHSHFSRKAQPPQYSEYTIFTAEVASTFSEQLLFEELMKKLSSPEEKAYLLNQKLEEIRTTLFRQLLFALYEQKIHNLVEEGTPLTSALLTSEYEKLLQSFFGEEVEIHKTGLFEWARIPHFYYGFYVYQYASGISAAIALHALLKKEGELFVKRYLNFLSSGSSGYPIDLLKAAGVDMESKEPVHAAIDHFESLLHQFSKQIS